MIKNGGGFKASLFFINSPVIPAREPGSITIGGRAKTRQEIDIKAKSFG